MPRLYNPNIATYNQRRAYERLMAGVGDRNNAREVRAAGANWPFLVLKCRPGSRCRYVTVRTIRKEGYNGYVVYEGTNRRQGESVTHEAWSTGELDSLLAKLGVEEQ